MNYFLKSFNIVYDIFFYRNIVYGTVKLFLDDLRFIKIFWEILSYDSLWNCIHICLLFLNIHSFIS